MGIKDDLMVKGLLGSLDKDRYGIPTTPSLVELMMKIDNGVGGSGWPLQRRAELMKRIARAAIRQQEAIVAAMEQESADNGGGEG